MDIEQRGYVLGIAIDKADPAVISKNDLEYSKMESGIPRYTYSIQIPIISRSQSKPSSQGGGGGGGPVDRSWILKMHGNSFFEVNREYATRLDYPPYYPHLQAIVISAAVAEEGIALPIDVFLRDTEMRRRTKLFITPGKADAILKVSPKIDDYSALYLRSLIKGSEKTSSILHKTDLGEVSKALHGNHDFVLPRVVGTDEEIKDSGCAVFKNDKMVGWLDEVKTAYTKWIADAVKGDSVVIQLPDSIDETITLEVAKLKTKKTPIINGDDITMKIETKASLNIVEVTSSNMPISYTQEFIKKVTKAAEEHLKKELTSTIKYVQKEFGADTFFFYRSMERYAPDTWDKVKDNWHEVFVNIKPEVTVKVSIEHTGLVK
jgi:spore germination protein